MAGNFYYLYYEKSLLVSINLSILILWHYFFYFLHLIKITIILNIQN